MEDKLIYVNLLVLIQNFENLWNMYSVSEGILYRDQVKESAKEYLKLFNVVSDKDAGIRNSRVLHIKSVDSTEYIDSINQELEEWIKSDKLFPISSSELSIGDNENSRYYLQSYFLCISAFLVYKTKLEYKPVLCKSSGESAFHNNYVNWKDRFPWQISDQVDNNFLDLLSNNETVVVIGDIRKSQDLITYAVNPNTYRKNMVAFIDKVRKIVLENMGIFDRFTGDGFIFYFNAYLANMYYKDIYETVIDVCIKIQDESRLLFENWKQELRKLPQESIGLSIGIDSGTMNFLDDRMMFAIGTPAVWATRMCAAGNAGDIILNNLPYNRLREIEPGLNFDEVMNATKTGEQFKAFKLRYE